MNFCLGDTVRVKKEYASSYSVGANILRESFFIVGINDENRLALSRRKEKLHESFDAIKVFLLAPPEKHFKHTRDILLEK